MTLDLAAEMPSRRSDSKGPFAPGELLYHSRGPSIGPQLVNHHPAEPDRVELGDSPPRRAKNPFKSRYARMRRWGAAAGGALFASRYAILATFVLALTLTSGQGLEALRFVHEANETGGVKNGIGTAFGVAVLCLVIHVHTLCMLASRARVFCGVAQTQVGIQHILPFERGIAVVLSILPALALSVASWTAVWKVSDAWINTDYPRLWVVATLIMCIGLACALAALPRIIDLGRFAPAHVALSCAAVFTFAVFWFAMLFALGQNFGADTSSPHVVATGIASLLGLHGLLRLAAFWWSVPAPATAGFVALTMLAVHADQYAVLRGGVQPAHALLARDAIANWLAKRPDRRDYRTYPVFIVAAEGGGARAAHLTERVLSRLAQESPSFKQHLLAVVGVSGGSVGAAMWSVGAAPDLPPSRCGLANPRGPATTESMAVDPSQRAAGALQTDLLTPIFHSLFGTDLMEQLTGARTEPRDRATALEDALDSAWQERGGGALRGVCFSDLWNPADLNRPALILLGTDSRTGQRVAASHLLLSSVNQTEHVLPAEWRKGAALRTLAQERPWDVPILSAAFMSARFPVVSPGARLTAGTSAVVVDGGYFENSGVTTVLELLDAIDRPDIKPIVIRIENGGPDGDYDDGWFKMLMPQPALALYQTRGSRAAIAVEALSKRLPAEQRALFSVQTPRADIPLGWAIWTRARKELDAQVDGAHNIAAFQVVRTALVPDRPVKR